ncbi:hypothetical protein GO986_06950 [Deinococcus sp. HMF7620]|uniref:Uncharacterized protein n=1 Tax=Deinococcus arboris TaxID=2682977 RepID=A0A7C9LQ82_9DEIO|nr:hypothetical protein [Deinococcus arboris]MVN86501.1 hypothetical protein [Deinococcus arboris]
MNVSGRVRLVLDLRRQARQGTSGTALARDLLTRPEVSRFEAYALAMDAFGMGLREARELEWLLGQDHGGTYETIETVWTPYLSNSLRWPRRVAHLEIKEQDDVLVTVSLFDYREPQRDEDLVLTWGDGEVMRTHTFDLPISYRYAQPGTYSFSYQGAGSFPWTFGHTLNFSERQSGKTGLTFRDCP